MADDRPVNRRNFFRQGLKELLKPLSQAAAPLEEMVKQLAALDREDHALPKEPAQTQTAAAVPTYVGVLPIRPPGALSEEKFRETCSRCGECVRVCPVQCIKIDPAGVKGAGVPYIDIDFAACVLCDGLLCMHKCPTGALMPIPLNQINMGTAVWQEQSCLRTSGQACTICVDECPIGEMALVLDGARVKVIEDGCSGCGVCQNRCPTTPKSIVVKPVVGDVATPQARGRSRG